MTLLTAAGISKFYSGVRALNAVDFQLESGEVHALVGENGAGKSTLIKIITGAIAADAGQIFIKGKAVDSATPARMKALGVAAIYQQPSLFPHLSVSENIALAIEDRGWLRRVDWKSRRKRAERPAGKGLAER